MGFTYVTVIVDETKTGIGSDKIGVIREEADELGTDCLIAVTNSQFIADAFLLIQAIAQNGAWTGK